MPKLKLTKTQIDKISNPQSGQVDYFDTDLKGFGLRVGANSKTFFVQRDVKGKTVRKTIGRYGLKTPDQARSEALTALGMLADGIDPRVKKAESITLKEALADYIKHRGLKERTQKQYESMVYGHLREWLERPIFEVTPSDVLKKHRQITHAAIANRALSLFGSLYTYASAGKTVPENPIKILSQTKTWHKQTRRSGYLKPSEYQPFYNELIQNSDNASTRDAIILILYTGLRSNEASGLEWANVDFNELTFTALKTKNGTDHTLPMSRQIKEFFERRKEISGKGRYVFPAVRDTEKSIRLRSFDIPRITGFRILVHDLRRSFASLCESLEVSHAATKRLLNHSMNTEITSSYMQIGLDRLRPILQKIDDHVEKLITGQAAKVLEFPGSKAV